MDAPTPDTDLDNLTISDLESLLADKRRRQGQRMLRTIAGRTQAAASLPMPLRSTHGLAGPPPAAPPVPPPDQATPSPPSPPLLTIPLLGPNPDRFGRPVLVSSERPRPRRGPAWLRRPGVQPWIDRGLQWAEVGIVLILLLVIGEWLVTSYSTTDDTSAIMASSALAPRPPVRPRTTVSPLIGSAQTRADQSATPTAPPARATPLPTSHSGGLAAPPWAPTATPQPAPTAVPTATPTPDPELRLPIRLVIPKIGVDTPVREVDLNISADQATWEVADFMAGHHTGTADPGAVGNVVIAGHRDIRGKVFYKLDKLRAGDEVYVYTAQTEYRYIVRLSKIVRPTAVEVMAPTEDARLTLITCTPIGIASSRLIIVADLDPSYTGGSPTANP